MTRNVQLFPTEALVAATTAELSVLYMKQVSWWQVNTEVCKDHKLWFFSSSATSTHVRVNQLQTKCILMLLFNSFRSFWIKKWKKITSFQINLGS